MYRKNKLITFFCWTRINQYITNVFNEIQTNKQTKNFKQTNISNTYLPSPRIRPYTNFSLQYPRWCKLLILDLQLTNPGFPWPCHDDRCHRPGEQRKWFWDFLKKLTSMKKITIKNTEGIWITDDLKSGLIKFRY